MLKAESCKECRYYEVYNNPPGGKYGHCRRFPPHEAATIITRGDIINIKGLFPRMHEECWCGEFSSTIPEQGLVPKQTPDILKEK